MIKLFKTFGDYTELSKKESNCWVNAIEPTSKEIGQLSEDYNIPTDIINDILDPDERSRIEIDDDWKLVILRIPVKSHNKSVPFYTVPLGIFIKNDFILTLCLRNNDILPIEIKQPNKLQYKEITGNINNVLRLFLQSSTIYIKYLTQIKQQTEKIEEGLEKSIKNEELNKLLKLEKCLVYFITSTKANEIVLSKLKTYKSFSSEINEDLLEDAIIENKQALEIAQIYSDIQNGIMDVFASVISNNLNIVMKQLTIISIILMIPTLIASMLGMNVPNYMEHAFWTMPTILIASVLLSIVGVILFRKKHWF